MTMSSATDTIIVADSGAEAVQHSYVDWPAVIAGIVLASAISVLMLAFGSAIGLSFANFHGGGAGVSPIWIGIAAASWLLWVEISSLLAGGYIAGRMRRRIHDATEHESDIRDGAHGLLVWAGSLLVGAVIAVSGISAAVSTIGGIASTATTAVATAAAPAAGVAAQSAAGSGFDPASYFTDTLFRPAAPAASATPAAANATPAASTAAPAAAAPAAAATAAPAASDTAATPAPAAAATTPASPAPAAAMSAPSANRADATAEAGRILANGAVSGSISDPDKTYLAQLVSENTGLSTADAKTRVDTVLSSIDAAKQKVADTAETARKAGVVGAFIIAASLLVAAAAAYWAAMLGGNHRDNQTVFETWGRRR